MKKILCILALWMVLPAVVEVIYPGGGYVPLTAQQETPPTESRWQRFLQLFQTDDDLSDVLDTMTVNRPTLNAEESVRERYSNIYNLIHQKESARYQSLVDSSYTDWAAIHDLKRDAKYIGDDTIVLARNIKVFGWHPHWMGPAFKNYNFKLLSHVALFSYNVNTGAGELPYDNPEVIQSWQADDFDLVPLAHADSCKVLITITNFGAEKNRIFLNDIDRQNRLIEDVFTLMETIGADGIDIDFELIPENYEKRFSAFIKLLKARLAKGSKEYLLTVVLPKVNQGPNGNNIYNIDTLQRYVDFFTLTGYDFTTGRYAAGPIAPLYNENKRRGKSTSIEDVVFDYLEGGLNRKQLLLGLPNYGGKWTQRIGRGNRPDSISFQHLTYSNIRKQYRRYGPPKYDMDRWGAVYTDYKKPEDTLRYSSVEETLWYDDSLTLSVKYDWVLEQGLGGVGIWALGYDQPFTELWGLVDDKFAPVNDTIVYYQPAQSVFSLPSMIMKYRDLIGVSGLFVFVFLAVAFVWALFDWRVREVFFANKTLRALYIVAAFAIVTASFALFLFLKPRLLDQLGWGTAIVVTLIAGLGLGALLVRVISWRFGVFRSKLP